MMPNLTEFQAARIIQSCRIKVRLLQRHFSISHTWSRCRALLPGLIKFAYIPRNEHRIHGDAGPSKRDRGVSPGPDFILPQTSVSVPEDEDHVLVLELAENFKGKKSETNAFVNFLSK
jgi:hypothetical protein